MKLILKFEIKPLLLKNMRKKLLLLLLIPIAIFAQKIVEGQSTLTYSLPKTEFVIQINGEKVTEKTGRFYQYSERYLATSDVILADKTYFRLKSITITPYTTADKSRTFTFVPQKKSITSHLTVNEKGILCGINTEPAEIKNLPKPKTINIEYKSNESKPLPLSEEDLLAGSVAKIVESTAKQIYRIRENRIDLLSGDVEFTPTDGQSMQSMIAQMDKQEEELTKLFTGTTTIEEFSQALPYTPIGSMKDEVLFRFSSFEGVVPSNDLSGKPYYISIDFKPIEKIPTEKNKKKAKEEIFVIQPVTSNVIISDGAQVFWQNTLILPQLGELTTLPIELLDTYSKVIISPENGRILSIEKGQKR